MYLNIRIIFNVPKNFELLFIVGNYANDFISKKKKRPINEKNPME